MRASTGATPARDAARGRAIGETSSAAAEQLAGIGQANGAMSQLDPVTQQNTALVDESAAAAESLRHQADSPAKAIGADVSKSIGWNPLGPFQVR